jgi:glycerate kinase
MTMPPPRVVVAMDKFRGTALAPELCEAIAKVAQRFAIPVHIQPMSDGGEGFADAFVGTDVMVEACGPLEEPTQASVRMSPSAHGLVGVIEVADVIGRDRLVSPSGYQALAASSRGVGYLVLACQKMGASSLVVGCGGSATSDGGLGCYWYLRNNGGLRVPVKVATDITARFSGAARYAVQKGVHPDDLRIIERRLEAIRETYLREQGVDVELIERTGAAGGIAGALVALGATPIGGFEAVSDAVGLDERLENCTLVISGEGRLDQGSLEGKVVVSLAQRVGPSNRLVLICGSVDADAGEQFLSRFPHAEMISLSDRYGIDRALTDTLSCVEEVADDVFRRFLDADGH